VGDQLKRAALVPYDSSGKKLEETRKIPLDFNPESLTIKVQSGQEKDRGRRGKQQVQHVGNSTATLSFDAIFDSTRPREPEGGEVASTAPEKLDVRHKTAAIANLLQVEKKGEKPAPRRVRFAWGTINFDGLIESFSETLDYFSPEGVPLRAKVSISITEQHFRYRIKPDQVDSPRAPRIGDAAALAANNDLDSLFDLTKGSGNELDDDLDLDVPPAAPPPEAPEALGLDLGGNVDPATAAGAGLDLPAAAALELFGADVLDRALGGNVDVSSAIPAAVARKLTPPPGRPANPWSPEGPTPGSRAAALAGLVKAARESGAALNTAAPAAPFSATQSPSATDGPAAAGSGAPAAAVANGNGGRPARATPNPLPVRGSPPLVAPRFGPPPPGGLMSRKRVYRPEHPVARPNRPAWEGLPPAGGALADRSEGAPTCGCDPAAACGCSPHGTRAGSCGCSGGHRRVPPRPDTHRHEGT
jgi:hypothetical protein